MKPVERHYQTPHLARRFWLVVFLAAWLVIFGLKSLTAWSATDTDTMRAKVQYTTSSYRLGPGDVLSMTIYNQPDLSQTEILVRDDGNASFNGVGELFVAGKTLREVKDMLAEGLRELVIEPNVTVNIIKGKPSTVYLAGAVKKPGAYQVIPQSPSPMAQPAGNRTDLRLSNVLANAGGVLMNADISRIEVRDGSTGQTRQVDLWSMIRDGDPDADIWLQSGDTVFIPELATKQPLTGPDATLMLRSSIGADNFPVRIIGEVTTPGVYPVDGLSPYLNSVLARAGGFKETANRKVVAIRRITSNDNFTIHYINPNQQDVMLQPNDVVFVAERKLSRIGRNFEMFGQVFAPFGSVLTPFLIFQN